MKWLILALSFLISGVGLSGLASAGDDKDGKKAPAAVEAKKEAAEEPASAKKDGSGVKKEAARGAESEVSASTQSPVQGEAADKKDETAEKKADAGAEGAKNGEERKAPPETILLDKTAKLAPVKFTHKAHAENPKLEGCKSCHEGEKPLFGQKRGVEGMKMADMYAGKGCGACHDGKKAFAAKTGCMKCHKK